MKDVAPLSEVAIHTLQEMHRYPPSRRARLRACQYQNHETTHEKKPLCLATDPYSSRESA